MKTKNEKIYDANDMKIALLEQTIHKFDETLIRFEYRFDSLDKKIDFMSKRLDSKLDKLNNKIWFNFYWMIAGFTSVLGILAHCMHWI